MAQRKAAPLVGVVMGSESDWDIMRHAVAQLDAFGVPNEPRVVSAHRMPDDMFEYAEDAAPRGLRVIIAGAGGAAHLPGMLAAKTTVPVLGVPVPSKYLRGEDSLLSIVQFDSAGQVVAVLLPLTIAQFVIGNIIDPLAMGNSLNLSPFAILASLAVWTALWGIPGAFLAVPITAILTIVLSEFPGARPISVLLSRNGKV